MTSRHRTFVVILPFAILATVFPITTVARPQQDQPQARATDISALQAQAAAGDATAQLQLARAYEKGDGVPQDGRQAFDWYRKAADQGDAFAQNRVGELYRGGEGVQQNKAEAVRWYCKAARQGNADAMCNLGVALYNGDGVYVSDSLSYAWFLLAKEAGCPRAPEAVQRAETEISPLKITKAYAQIAGMYEKAECLSSNPVQEARWLSKAAERGDDEAQFELAFMLLDGRRVPQDLNGGQHWCSETLKKNQALGGYCKGYIYQNGLGVARDGAKARKFYQRGVEYRSTRAMKALALMEMQGEGGKVDRVGACLLYARLAEGGDKQALRNLSTLRAQMTAKDWQKVEKELPSVRIDPKKLEAAMQHPDAAQ
jgi:TPR repeat protein